MGKLNPKFKLKSIMQNLITKTSFQVLSMLLCVHISNYRIEPSRVFDIHIDLSHLESEDTLNIHMQTCILGKMLMYSHFSSTLPKIGQRICSKTGLQLWGEKMHKLRLTTNYILWDIQIILRLFRSLHKSKLKQVSNYLHSSIIQ